MCIFSGSFNTCTYSIVSLMAYINMQWCQNLPHLHTLTWTIYVLYIPACSITSSTDTAQGGDGAKVAECFHAMLSTVLLLLVPALVKSQNIGYTWCMCFPETQHHPDISSCFYGKPLDVLDHSYMCEDHNYGGQHYLKLTNIHSFIPAIGWCRCCNDIKFTQAAYITPCLVHSSYLFIEVQWGSVDNKILHILTTGRTKCISLVCNGRSSCRCSVPCPQDEAPSVCHWWQWIHSTSLGSPIQSVVRGAVPCEILWIQCES